MGCCGCGCEKSSGGDGDGVLPSPLPAPRCWCCSSNENSVYPFPVFPRRLLGKVCACAGGCPCGAGVFPVSFRRRWTTMPSFFARALEYRSPHALHRSLRPLGPLRHSGLLVLLHAAQRLTPTGGFPPARPPPEYDSRVLVPVPVP